MEVAEGQKRRRVAITIFMVTGMLVVGTCTTILSKYQNTIPVDEHGRQFEQPVYQSLIMFIGELFCLLFFYGSRFIYYVRSRRPLPPVYTHQSTPVDSHAVLIHPSDILASEKSQLLRRSSLDVQSAVSVEESDSRVEMNGVAHLWMGIPAFLDFLGTTLMNVGLIFVPASVYQMSRGSVVIFTAIISFFWLKRRISREKVFALLMISLGITLVGLANVLGSTDDSSNSSNLQRILGSPLIILAQIASATQFVVEEKIVMHYKISPMKIVGFEGLFGLTYSVLFLAIMYLAQPLALGGMFNIAVGLSQVLNDSRLWGSSIAFALCVGAFNYFGLNITHYVSATARTTIDTSRTISIWIVCLLLPFFKEKFSWLQLGGFLLLIYGTFVFNQVMHAVPAPLLKCCRKRSGYRPIQ